MLVIISILICIVNAFLYLIDRRYVGVIFNIVWMYIFLIIRANSNDFRTNVIGLLIIMVVCFNIGYAVLRYFKIAFRLKSGSKSALSIKTNNYSVEVNHQVFGIIIIVALMCLCYYTVKTISSVGLNLRIIRSSNRAELNIFNSFIDTFLFYGFCGSVAHLGPLTIIYNYISRIKNKRWEIVVVLLNTVLYIISDAGRMLIIRIALFTAAAFIWGLENRNSTKKISIKKALLIVGVIGIALSITTASRNMHSVSFLEQMQNYIGGSIVHMNYQIEVNPEGGYHFGTVVYGGFFYYLTKILNLFGFNIQNSNEIMTFLQSYKMLSLGNKNIYYNALVPNAYYYYYDSGVLGVIIFSCILGVFTARYERLKGRPSFFNYVMFAMALYAVVFSPLGGIFWNFRMPTVVIIAYILRNKIYRITYINEERFNEPTC